MLFWPWRFFLLFSLETTIFPNISWFCNINDKTNNSRGFTPVYWDLTTNVYTSATLHWPWDSLGSDWAWRQWKKSFDTSLGWQKKVNVRKTPWVYHGEWSPSGSPVTKSLGLRSVGFWPWDFPRDYIHHDTTLAFPHIVPILSVQGHCQ